jgi:hypothetical protein
MVVKRSHTSANVAPSIRKLLEQTNAKYPKRSKDSDGIWPSAAHTKANPNSDHEAGNALDITADLGTKTTMRGFIAWVLVNPHPALEYIIHDGTIWSRSRDFKPVRYAGSNPHRSHAHFSVRESKRSSTRAWVLPADYPLRVLKVGEKGIHVRYLKKQLHAAGYRASKLESSTYGSGTAKDVKAMRTKEWGPGQTGNTGPKTWALAKKLAKAS